MFKFNINEKSKESFEAKVLLSKIFDKFRELNIYQKRHIFSQCQKNNANHQLEYTDYFRNLIAFELFTKEDFTALSNIIGDDEIISWNYGPHYEVVTYVYLELRRIIYEDSRLTSFFS